MFGWGSMRASILQKLKFCWDVNFTSAGSACALTTVFPKQKTHRPELTNCCGWILFER